MDTARETNGIMMGPGEFSERCLPLGHLDMPPPGVVHLWFFDLLKLGSPLAPPGHGPETLGPRQERTARRFYLRLLLGAYLGVPGKEVKISRLVRGKPVLSKAVHPVSLDFSSAGSNGCCMVGVCTAGQVGVDLEEEGRRAGRPAALVERYFSEREKAMFAAMPESDVDRAFLHTWACKEAVVKAAGHGIANQLCRFTVSTDPDAPAGMLEIEDDDPGQWQLAVVRPDERCIASVALRHDRIRIEGFSLNHGS